MPNSKIKMSNKKNHKIDITDVAINRVSKIEFEEIPKEEHLIISNLAKMVLEISKENNNSNEVSITYNKYDVDKNMLLLNKAGNEYNKSKSLKKKLEAIKIFLKGCKKNGIIYKKR